MTGAVLFCKRTNDPKLAWIQRELSRMGIANKREGESFHAPIVWIDADKEEQANSILVRRIGRYSIDDIRDDHPRWNADIARREMHPTDTN